MTTATETVAPLGAIPSPSGNRTAPAVAHVVPEFLPRSATFIYTAISFQERFRPIVLARRLSNLDEFAVDGPVLGLDEREVTRFPIMRARRLRAYERRLAREVQRHGCSVVHAHFGWSGPPALAAAHRNKLPLVTTFYGLDLAARKRRRQLHHPYRQLFANGTLFTCEGSHMAQVLQSIGCPADRIRVVKIGIDLSRFAFTPRKRTRPLILVQAARLVEKKAVDVTIRSFAAARPRLGPAELRIVGDGPLRPELERLADRLGLAGSVRFLGELSHRGYIDAITDAHLCLQPSRTTSDGDTEGGAPTVLIEMQALGIGVVATRHADIPNVVASPDDLVAEDDVDGVADAIVKMADLSDRDWDDRLVAARTYVERSHDARVTTTQLAQIYDEAVALAALAPVIG